MLSDRPMSKIAAVILAAGQGTRMKSALPKVMHPIAGRPLVHFPVRSALEAGCDEVIVVVGHGREHVTRYLAAAFGERVKTVVQTTQLGTGDAARYGVSAIADCDRVLVFYGDVPLLEAGDLASATRSAAPFALATIVVDDPAGYGRILRDESGDVLEIREHKDLRSDAERAVREINPTLGYVDADFLDVDRLSKKSNDKKRGKKKKGDDDDMLEPDALPARIEQLRVEMRKAASDMEFERAAELRDRVRALEARALA